MTGNTATYIQNFTSENKLTDIVEKDIRKWVESVGKFKAKLEKQKSDTPLEKHLKKNKKFKTNKKPSLIEVQVGNLKSGTAPQSQTKHTKPKKQGEKIVKKTEEKPKESSQIIDFFDAIKETYRNLELPPNWTSGLSNNRVVFNRIKVTTHNAQQKMIMERSLVVTKDCTAHVLINGTEITFANWEVQKINTLEDIKKAIKDIDSFKICHGPQTGIKSSQCYGIVENARQKVCQARKSDTASPAKAVKGKQKVSKKTSGPKEIPKQKSFQK